MITHAHTSVEVQSWQERAFAMHRHLLRDRDQDHLPNEVATAMLGLHAARLSSPWVAIRARVDSFEPRDLRQQLREHRSLLKLRCMRRTLHIVPLDLAPVVHTATLDQRLGACRALLRRTGRSEGALKRAAAAVLDHLAGRTDSYRALEQAMTGGRADRTELARLAIKWLWERGDLLYLDLSPSLHHERRSFARTRDVLPDLDLSGLDVATAQERLVMAHIRAYGPVSVADIAWWSGIGRGRVLRALERHRPDLVPVRIQGISAPELLLHVDDLEKLLAMAPMPSDHLALLSHEDPALKGYFDTRPRYVDDAGYGTLFNSIGEARSSILANGRVVGIWGWDHRGRRIWTKAFSSLSRVLRRALAERVSAMEQFLAAEMVRPLAGETAQG